MSKPSLFLMDIREMTGKDIDRLYKKLTGRKPTKEESKEARELVLKIQNQLSVNGEAEESTNPFDDDRLLDNYDPEQVRDEFGKWTDDAGGDHHDPDMSQYESAKGQQELGFKRAIGKRQRITPTIKAQRDCKAHLLKLANAAVGRGVSPKELQDHIETLHEVVDQMTEPMAKAVMEHVGKLEVYPSSKDLTEGLGVDVNQGIVGGAFSFKRGENTGTLNIDGDARYSSGQKIEGGSPRNVYAHELGHAVDFGGKFSNTDKWIQAGLAEIMPKTWTASEGIIRGTDKFPLTRYATTHPTEGFAEYFRLVNMKPDAAKKDFPKCWSAFKDWGLV